MFNPVEKDRLLPREETVLLEGDYVTWNYIQGLTLDDCTGFGLFQCTFIDEIRELLYVFYRDDTNDARFVVFNIRTGATVFLSPNGVNYTILAINNNQDFLGANNAGFLACSSRQRYIVFEKPSTTDFEIWKDGALMQSINILTYEVGATVRFLHMSRGGRWLVFRTVATLHVFEGV